jgi:hypothetical protein
MFRFHLEITFRRAGLMGLVAMQVRLLGQRLERAGPMRVAVKD